MYLLSSGCPIIQGMLATILPDVFRPSANRKRSFALWILVSPNGQCFLAIELKYVLYLFDIPLHLLLPIFHMHHFVNLKLHSNCAVTKEILKWWLMDLSEFKMQEKFNIRWKTDNQSITGNFHFTKNQLLVTTIVFLFLVIKERTQNCTVIVHHT